MASLFMTSHIYSLVVSGGGGIYDRFYSREPIQQSIINQILVLNWGNLISESLFCCVAPQPACEDTENVGANGVRSLQKFFMLKTSRAAPKSYAIAGSDVSMHEESAGL